MEVGFDGIAPKRPRRISDMYIYCSGNLKEVFHVPGWVHWSPSAPNASASQAVRPPILIGIDFDLSKTKNWDVKRTTPHSPARSLKQHSVEASLHHAVKSLVRSDSRS